MAKKIVIFAAPIIYLNYTVDDLLKTVQVKNILRFILSIRHIKENLYRIMFNLFVLTVNLNLYCSSEALEIRANHLYCMCLTSVSYAHCGFRAKQSRANFDREIPTRIVSICRKTFSRPEQVAFQTKITRQVD